MSCSKNLLSQKPDVIVRTVMNVITPISLIFILNRFKCCRSRVNVCVRANTKRENTLLQKVP